MISSRCDQDRRRQGRRSEQTCRPRPAAAHHAQSQTGGETDWYLLDGKPKRGNHPYVGEIMDNAESVGTRKVGHWSSV